MMIGKTKVEYGDYAWNFYPGCSGSGCAVKDQCWAERMNRRFHWVKDFRKPEFKADKFREKFPKKPSTILVNFMGDIMRPEVDDETIMAAISRCQLYPEHRFLWLTKNPERYGKFRYPENCWLGTTVNIWLDILRLRLLVSDRRLIGNNKWVSIEPLMEDITTTFNKRYFRNIDFVVIGGYSQPSKIQPKREWISNILEIADRYKIKTFMKDNLKPVWSGKLRKELPVW